MNKVKTSRFLSLVLRHQPEKIGLQLDANGFAPVTHILEKMKISMAHLEEVVATNPKKRFAFNEDKTLIRASQGHSVEVDLALEERDPPRILYHGTNSRVVSLIRENGLKKMNRHHVHLSADQATATNVGNRRRGNLMIIRVAARQMREDGYTFYRSANGVWLTDHVPPEYLTLQ